MMLDSLLWYRLLRNGCYMNRFGFIRVFANIKISILIFFILFVSFNLSRCTSLMQPINTKYSPASKFVYESNKFINYREIGTGEDTIILIHGFGASNRVWDDSIKYMQGKDYRLLLIDMPGSGFSSLPPNNDFSIALSAKVISDFIKSKNLKNYTLVGHSSGGGVVLNIVLNLDKTKVTPPNSIILLDAAAYDTGLPFFVSNLRIPILSSTMLKVTSPEFRARYTLEKVYFDKTKVTSEKIYRYSYFMSLPNSDLALLESAKQIIPKNYNELISKYKSIKLPTLIIWGAQDTALSIDGGKRLANEINGAKLVIVNQCGHNPQEEHPQEVATEITRFIESLGTRKD